MALLTLAGFAVSAGKLRFSDPSRGLLSSSRSGAALHSPPGWLAGTWPSSGDGRRPRGQTEAHVAL